MKIRIVTLHQGPSDGVQTVASHDTAFLNGELYVYDGGKDLNRFVHAKTMLTADRSMVEISQERKRVEDWMNREPVLVEGCSIPIPAPMSELIGIPPHRINAWYQLLKIEA